MTQECEELVRKFKRHGYKMTPQRRAILEEIAVPGAHPTAEQIHESVRQSMPDSTRIQQGCAHHCITQCAGLPAKFHQPVSPPADNVNH